MVIAIGRMSDFGLKGLSGLSSNEWYRNVILNDLDFNADELLEYAFPKLIKQNSNRLPFFKFLSKTHNVYPEVIKLANKTTFDTIISDSIKNNRNALGKYTSVKEIWKKEKDNFWRATHLISHLKSDQIRIEDLERILYNIFSDNREILETCSPNVKTNIRRLIRIYDCLKFKK